MGTAESGSNDRNELRAAIARRVRLVREELYGESGGPLLARALHISHSQWFQFESGEAIPAQVLLQFLEITSVESRWLYSGQGARYRDRNSRGPSFDYNPDGPESSAG